MSEALLQIQQRAEQRIARIMDENRDSLLRFHSFNPRPTAEDIETARRFVGACLIEHMAIEEQVIERVIGENNEKRKTQ